MTSRVDTAGAGGPGASTTGRPIIQVSVDVPTTEEALQVAGMALRAGVDWLEVGTPLILYSGLPATAAMAKAYPGTPIFADVKIVDGAKKYVVSAAEHGVMGILDQLTQGGVVARIERCPHDLDDTGHINLKRDPACPTCHGMSVPVI